MTESAAVVLSKKARCSPLTPPEEPAQSWPCFTIQLPPDSGSPVTWHLPHPAQQLALGFQVEINQHVPQQQHVYRPGDRPRLDQIDLAELHHAANVVLGPPDVAHAVEVLDQQPRGQAAVDLDLAEKPF